jgi:hypothetical protein
VVIPGVFLFALAAGKKSGREPIAADAVISPSLQKTVIAPSASIPAPPPVASIRVDDPIEIASEDNAGLRPVVEHTGDKVASDGSPAAVPSSDIVARPGAPVAAPLKKRTKPRLISAPLPKRTEPNVANIKPAVPQGASDPTPAGQLSRVIGTPATSASLSPSLPAAPAAASADSAKPIGNNPASIPEKYLEVGSFGDTKWADDAVERLSQLGFHAICVHKTVLWKQSYHVQVGPYVTAEEIDDAEKRLTDRGFKSHIVK